MEKVIIKCFKTPVAKYFYDRHLDTVVAVNDEEYETLKEIEKTGKVLENNGLNRFVKNGLLSPTIIKEIEHPDTAILQLLSEDYMSSPNENKNFKKARIYVEIFLQNYRFYCI